MKPEGSARKILAGVSAGALALSVIACTGCTTANAVLYPGAHTYHELDSNWDLAYGWYEAEIPEGFFANNLGTVFSSTEDTLYTFDNPEMPNTSSYQSIQVRLERGYIDSTELKTTASDTAWSNDPDYANAVPFIEYKTTYEKQAEKKIGDRTWTVMEASPAVDSSIAAERQEPAAIAKKSCKYLTQLDDKAYMVVDGYQIAAGEDLIENFLESIKTVDGNYYDTFEAWTFEKSISKKSPAGMW